MLEYILYKYIFYIANSTLSDIHLRIAYCSFVDHSTYLWNMSTQANLIMVPLHWPITAHSRFSQSYFALQSGCEQSHNTPNSRYQGWAQLLILSFNLNNSARQDSWYCFHKWDLKCCFSCFWRTLVLVDAMEWKCRKKHCNVAYKWLHKT